MNKNFLEKEYILNLVGKSSKSSISNTHDEAKRVTGRPRGAGK